MTQTGERADDESGGAQNKQGKKRGGSHPLSPAPRTLLFERTKGENNHLHGGKTAFLPLHALVIRERNCKRTVKDISCKTK